MPAATLVSWERFWGFRENFRIFVRNSECEHFNCQTICHPLAIYAILNESTCSSYDLLFETDGVDKVDCVLGCDAV
jgi:hypothetical protein